MKDKNENPWREEPVIEREGYQLRSNEEARSEWRTALIVSAIVIVLSVIAADSLGSRNGPERPRIEIQSK